MGAQMMCLYCRGMFTGNVYMNTDRLVRYSQLMAAITQILIIGMLFLNAVCWLFPSTASAYGFGFSLTASVVYGLEIIPDHMPWWQVMGGILLSSIPLLILARGLRALRGLFCIYGTGEYFSHESALLLGKVGQGVALWVLSSFLLEPIISIWATMLQPAGERIMTLSFDSSQVVALFLAGSVMVIARILGLASAVAAENRQFI